ncbi:MAG TPA: NfeD family protein [Chitinophagaceae bacterium]|nr:NfeD family protein [Chitinophagaceae bacterium]
MDNFMQPAVIWFIIGFILFLLEFVVPGLILFFFSVGAWIVAILTLFFPLAINYQLIIFVISSIISILLLRKWVKKLIYGKNPSRELLEDEFLGKTARAVSAISPGENGKVDFKGTIWQAASEDVIEKEENVIITGNESILLIVKSTKKL